MLQLCLVPRTGRIPSNDDSLSPSPAGRQPNRHRGRRAVQGKCWKCPCQDTRTGNTETPPFCSVFTDPPELCTPDDSGTAALSKVLGKGTEGGGWVGGRGVPRLGAAPARSGGGTPGPARASRAAGRCRGSAGRPGAEPPDTAA